MALLLFAAVVLWAVALCFGQLTVLDRGDDLEMISGPVPLFRNRIPYRLITQVESVRPNLPQNLVKGGGFRKIRGMNGIRIRVYGRMIRIGTDDPEGLIRLIRSKMEAEEGK